MNTSASRPVRRLVLLAAIVLVTSSPGVLPLGAACPPGDSNPITSGTGVAGLPVVFTRLGGAPRATFFVLGAADAANSGSLPASAWLVNLGDLDGDGLPDYRIAAPGVGPGGWGDPRTVGCPSTLDPPHPPLVIVITHAREDLDGDGAFDVWEDQNLDRDGDGRITPPGGCEGILREDKDCDGHLDNINEDLNGNGRLDFGEDIDGDGRLDDGTEDRNHNSVLDDRPFPKPGDAVPLDCKKDASGLYIYPCIPTATSHSYPYGSLRPAPGGIVVVTVAWNGTAYDVDTITTPGRLIPGEDKDGDGAFDVWEPRNLDRDHDGRITPPGGCEGILREDKDCDGHLDNINEDVNGNGRLDPGEDRDGDGRLDDGTEDRNHNGLLDDRPFPRPGDGIPVDCYTDGSGRYAFPCIPIAISDTYPYGSFQPARQFRAIDAAPLERLTPVASGVRRRLDGSWRVRLDVAGVDLNDDLGGARAVFELYRMALEARPALASATDLLAIQAAPTFLETGGCCLTIPAAGNGASGVFASLIPSEPADPRPRFVVEGLPLPAPGVVPPFTAPDLLDADGDGVPLPLDDCPDLPDPAQIDQDRNGLGDACDPALRPGADLPSRWIEVARDQGPGARSGAAAAYDAARGVVVLFGGSADTGTWELSGEVWTRRATTSAPEARSGHGMVYDSVRGQVILFGGTRLSDGVALGDLWRFDGDNWSRIRTAFSPPVRASFGLAFDAEHRLLVLFGGRVGARTLGDTWVFDGSGWRAVPSPRSPAARSGAQMAYDAFRRLVVLHGGVAGGGPATALNDTWEFDGLAWQEADTRGGDPPVRDGVMAFDPARRQIVLFGGRAPVFAPLLPPSDEAVAATRLYDGASWATLPTQITAPWRSLAAGAFDRARGVLVVEGGLQDGTTLADTEELHRPDDTDGDGVLDANDNCPLVANGDQLDADADGVGDACDDCRDVYNPTQRDLDRDGLGDACDDDVDGDGVPNAQDACPASYVAGRPFDAVLEGGGPDSDGDAVPDDCDRCPRDPANDADGDGLCGDVDNCPAAFNPLQEDANGDGAGDACQPSVTIVSIDPTREGTLDARVAIGDPDGDRIRGEVRILATASLLDARARISEACSLAFLPDGVPGQGLIYGAKTGTLPAILADAASLFGCSGVQGVFLLASGTCATASPSSFAITLTLDRPTPFPICARRFLGGASFDYTVWSVTPGAALLGPVGPPLIVRPYEMSRLPDSVDLSGLPRPGSYILQITATDGNTPEVSDARIFTIDRQTSLVFNRPRRFAARAIGPGFGGHGSAGGFPPGPGRLPPRGRFQGAPTPPPARQGPG